MHFAANCELVSASVCVCTKCNQIKNADACEHVSNCDVILMCLCLQEARCGYAIILMALYWCTECMPLAVTALLPVILFPMMGIMKGGDVGSFFSTSVLHKYILITQHSNYVKRSLLQQEIIE